MKKILFYVFSFFLLQIGNINDALAVTYRLQRVTNVKAGEKYVFEQAGRVMNNTISNNALETTNSYKTYGLTGDEGYVWTLATAKEDLYIKNGNNYLSLIDTGPSLKLYTTVTGAIWTFKFQKDGTAIINNKNDASSFLGYKDANSTDYKCFNALGQMGYEPHSIVVYKLVRESDNSPRLAFDNKFVKIIRGEGYDAPSLSKAEGFDGTISFTSSNTKVATVDAATGEVTILRPGRTVITASSSSTAQFDSGEASYTLLVMEGNGSASSPYSISDVISGYMTINQYVYVKGFIVGDYTSSFSLVTTVNSNNHIALADDLDGVTKDDISLVELTTDSLKQNFGLKDHPDRIGLRIVAYGRMWYINQKTSIDNVSYISLATSYPVTITSYKYASYRTPTKLDFSGMDVSAYTASVGGDNVVLTKIEDGIVPANKGVILYSETAGTYDVPVTDAATSLSDTGLSISDGSSATKESGIYVLGKKNGNVGFYRWIGDNSLPEGRVYLSPPAAARDYLSFMFDEETTKVEVSSHAACLSHERWSDLSGRSLTGRPTAKGVYVINGRKVVVK